MIKRLQLKFIAITMLIVIIVFAVVVITLNVFMNYNSYRQTEDLLKAVADNDGMIIFNRIIQENKNLPPAAPEFSIQMAPEANQNMKAAKFFYAKISHDKSITDMNYDMMYEYIREDVEYYVNEVLKRGNTSGSIDNLQYLKESKDYGHIIVFAERSIETHLLRQLTNVSVTISGIACVVLFTVSIILSRWAIKPVKDTFEKQKVFISDASHELKTPLTIISANTDVLRNEIGEHPRLKSIGTQTLQMQYLISSLLSLAKMDETDNKTIMSEFDLSEAVLSTTLEFESKVFEAYKTLNYNIDDNLNYIGNRQQIKQLVSILIDNAIKYSNENGIIEVNLTKDHNKFVISVFNSGKYPDDFDKERIFDRFYRIESSRSRETGGYGLGLAIAKSIVNTHKGDIKVINKENNGIIFSVIL